MKAKATKVLAKETTSSWKLNIMKAAENISETFHPSRDRFLHARSLDKLRADVIALRTICSRLRSAPEDPDYQGRIGCVPAKAIYLLTAFVTTPQRQALHARNFCNLPIAVRAVYLHCVAYAIGYTVISNGRMPNCGTLAAHLTDVTVTSIYDVPGVPLEDLQSFAEFLSLIEAHMKELNLLIPTDLVNSSCHQQAMYAGAVHSYALWQR
jgi:hypothetical protein